MSLLKLDKIIGFVAYSGTGKTTLLEKIIPILTSRGFKIAVIKHTHHQFDIDKPGKDSYRLRKSGACQIVMGSSKRSVMIKENTQQQDEPNLEVLVNQLDLEELDFILVEGFKHEAFNKIELHRNIMNKTFLYQDDPNIFAIILDKESKISSQCNLPQLDINNEYEIAEFLINRISNS
ncbi:MAG: molybdopterin-guanine dinucleotide biosynthesis protein B [Methylococcales bacterium]|jgi:molybdopterin-guanine dinucleotide biosynthesis adapter protein|nr:molybdopterin-guanine dinucleotide biosynthesis protein B [Methylococcales bacterium]MBT7410068.1 molybdopterin-guanine dinucleotide biosynthesis protein B [Methylococcales bacterium]